MNNDIPSARTAAPLSESAGDGQLAAPPPVLSIAEAEALARDYFDLRGAASPLTSERDANFRIRNDRGSYVLKIANPAEAALVTNLQTMALLHIERIDPTLPVQRVLRSIHGRHEEILRDAEGRPMVLRLFSYLEGEPLATVARTAAQRRAIGTALARLGLALRDLKHPAADHELVWDIKHASRLRQYLPYIEGDDRRALVERVITAFDNHVRPVMPSLRWQFVHSDLNPSNVLVKKDQTDEVAGILDFGDMVHTPLVNDLAVAASYQLGQEGNPLADAGDFIQAYHETNPLTATELDLLYDLIAARMATTACITSWRAARYPENRDYILRNAPRAWAGLKAFADMPREQAQDCLHRLCGA
ncbi:phosphotransferase [Dongia rigui]|uniref:Hydroxylysine kinase n=1 Tax=Dongia rigui TaxID=940149 RepID=A0ABU5E0P5_9PROT|nr:phosphotransferase [Dongia rigui]MDY0873158.1 phosphotransferase [Dongia rigui]